MMTTDHGLSSVICLFAHCFSIGRKNASPSIRTAHRDADTLAAASRTGPTAWKQATAIGPSDKQ